MDITVKGGETLLQEKTLYKCFCHVGNGEDCPLHWHESHEICQVLDGECKFLVDGVYYTITKGDIICINARVPHFSFDAKKDTRLRVFRTLPNNLLQISSKVDALKVYIPQSELALSGIKDELDFVLDALERRGSVPVDETGAVQQSLSAAVYFMLMEHFASDADVSKSKNKERKIFFQTLEYVNLHFTEPINVSTLANTLFYPRGKLSEIFTKYSGVRLGDHINSLRVQRANELIENGESITDAAFSSGFQNIRTFNNVYRAVMGMSPSEFTKKNA